MNRRKLLGAVGLGATGMAGFLGNGASGAGQDTETTQTTTSDGDGFTGIDSSAERPFGEIAVGTREGVRNPDNNQPHLLRVWNDSERARTIQLTLVRGGDAGRPPMDRTFEFPADGYLTMRLLEPASYRLRVGGGSGDVAGVVEVPRRRFDCNDSRTDVAVTPEGQVKSTTITTEEGCQAQVIDRTFTQFRGSCGTDNDASVTFAEESVEVRGSIQVPNPCYGAELADVSFAGSDTLRVTVSSTEPTAAFCAQCVATVRYRADLEFRDRVPEAVEVVHVSGDSSETVATVSRSAGGGTGGTTTGETASGGTASGGTTTGEATTGTSR